MTDEDDRRDVRSEAEGAVPDEKQTVTPEVEADGPAVGSTAGPSANSAGQTGLDGSAGTGDPGSSAGSADPGGQPGSAAIDGEEKPIKDSSGDDDDSGGGKKGKKDKKQGSFWKELPVLIGVALVLALVIKAFAVQAFYIPSASMQNTLEIGDRVLVNKIVYHTRDIERGDIVVFNGLESWDPEVEYEEPTNPISKFFRMIGSAFGVVPGEKDYIKRVIGVPGDRVKCCDAQGRVTVNGVPLDEKSYLYKAPDTGEQDKPSSDNFDVTVKPGNLWVMGDHRNVSYDSRQHRGDPGGGQIPEKRVIGRAFVIVWPLNRIGTLPIPKTFEQPALSAAGALMPATPLALGLVGAVPITLLNRRRRHRRTSR